MISSLRFTALLTGLLLLLSPGGAALLASDAPGTTVVFGGAYYYPPYYYRNHAGRPVGFDIDLISAISEQAEFGGRASVRLGNWSAIQEELATGHIDLVPMFVSPAREERYLFSNPILVEHHLIFGRQGSPSHSTLPSLAGLRVAAESGAHSLQELRRLGIRAEIVETASEAEALRMVANGLADVTISPRIIAFDTLLREDLSGIEALSGPLLPVTYAYAISPQRPELVEPVNQALITLQRSGITRELQQKWFSTSVAPSPPLFTLWIDVILGLVALAAAVGLFLYRHRLKRMHALLQSNMESLRSSRHHAQSLSRTNPLTGMANRKTFQQRLQRTSARAASRQTCIAVGIIKIQDLEYLQHTAGFQVAEDLIRQVAAEINQKPEGYKGYISEGHFSVLFDSVKDQEDAMHKMSSLVEAVSREYPVQGISIEPQLAAGFAVHPDHLNDEAELLRRASLALALAMKKQQSLACYEPAMEPVTGKLALMTDLKKALMADSISWAYQPQYSIAQQGVCGAEMLIRWHHPGHGWVAADKLISLAEQSGLIRQVTQAVIRQAIATLKLWHEQGKPWRLSVNVSGNDLSDRSTVESIIAHLGEYSSLLTLEITETAVMQDVNAIIANTELLRAASIKLAMDDYGTGYSSLAYLKELEFDEIKIDQKFIRHITSTRRDLMLTQSSIRLGHDLEALVVAEGVEDMETARLLASLGCDILQGYGISPPLNLDEFVEFAQDCRLELTESISTSTET